MGQKKNFSQAKKVTGRNFQQEIVIIETREGGPAARTPSLKYTTGSSWCRKRDLFRNRNIAPHPEKALRWLPGGTSHRLPAVYPDNRSDDGWGALSCLGPSLESLPRGEPLQWGPEGGSGHHPTRPCGSASPPCVGISDILVVDARTGLEALPLASSPAQSRPIGSRRSASQITALILTIRWKSLPKAPASNG